MGEDFNIVQFLKSAVATGASDEHLFVDNPPFIRINGFIKKTNLANITKEQLDNAILEIAPSAIKTKILSLYDIDFMYEISGCSRFRVNYNRRLGNPALVIRNISYEIPTFEDLSLSETIKDISAHKNGLILVTGPTGCGKSTTLAAIVGEILKSRPSHVITIEDPVEYIFSSAKGIVSQRQVGVDTASFPDGIKYSLRQDPDVILIGEIRDAETMMSALKAAETGHLVLSTLHTNDAVQTINRVINFFEESSRPIVRKELAETLRATIAQKLVYSDKMKKRYPACEILVVTPTVKDYILKDNSDEIYTLIKDNTNIDNMISMNKSLANLVNKDLISDSEALEASNDDNELEKMLRGVYQGTKAYFDEK